MSDFFKGLFQNAAWDAIKWIVIVLVVPIIYKGIKQAEAEAAPKLPLGSPPRRAILQIAKFGVVHVFAIFGFVGFMCLINSWAYFHGTLQARIAGSLLVLEIGLVFIWGWVNDWTAPGSAKLSTSRRFSGYILMASLFAAAFFVIPFIDHGMRPFKD